MNWQRMRLAGFGLFCLSFFLPNNFSEWQFFSGGMVFLDAPVFAFDYFREKSYWAALIVFAAWLANLSVPVPRRRWLAVLAMLAVWTAYVCFFNELVSFVPFYLWAIGITLVQVGNFSNDDVRRMKDGSGKKGRSGELDGHGFLQEGTERTENENGMFRRLHAAGTFDIERGEDKSEIAIG